MRALSFILSLYILVLTAMPCVDERPDLNVYHTELGCSSSNSQDNNFDHCSPFCSCNCCSIQVVLAEAAVLPPCTHFTHNEYSWVRISASPSPYSSIWQPPKLS